ncbi:Aste57867_10678 [Aphanomyces stellatus]|uniref:Aste57867_10678 protein n=1 Tax=Aphanomyces stellatus TaxID=120398 RepID=A0A485KQZ4_9STRA|nr:hypothetical protein As57867_010638 [Aphanomyces stellatus]VFT87550.1 Aste57867_10678 [Aphanomyces stellatus]
MNRSEVVSIHKWGAMQMHAYLPLTGLSMIAACISIFTAFETKDIRRSAVQYCTFSVFCCDCMWSFARFVLYVLGEINDETYPVTNKGDRSINATALDATTSAEAVVTVVGDLFIVAASIWIVLSAYEMMRVVTHTITRPEDKERYTILMYDIMIYMPIAVMLLAFCLFPIAKDDPLITSSWLRVSLYMVVWALFIAVLYLPYAWYKIYQVRRNRAGFFDHTLEHIYRRVRTLLIVYSCTAIPTSIVSLGYDIAQANGIHFLGDSLDNINFIANCIFYLTGFFNAISIGGSVLCCLRCLRPIMPKELHEDLVTGGLLRQSEIMLTSQNSLSPPVHLPVFVCTDIESSTLLWSRVPAAMTEAQSLHDDCMRQHLATYSGYEITTAGDAFQLAFHTVTEAISYCVTVQLKLLEMPWPKELNDYRSGKTITDMFGRTLFRGLRVRMAIHLGGGDMIHQIHPTTGKMTYSGLHEMVAREIGDSGLGGQILISQITKERFLEEMDEWPRPAKKDKRIMSQFKDFFFQDAPSCHIADLDLVEPMAEVVPYLLRARFTRADSLPSFFS